MLEILGTDLMPIIEYSIWEAMDALTEQHWTGIPPEPRRPLKPLDIRAAIPMDQRLWVFQSQADGCVTFLFAMSLTP